MIECVASGRGSICVTFLQASKMKLTIDLDVAAPHLIIPEDFTNQNSSLVCVCVCVCVWHVFTTCR